MNIKEISNASQYVKDVPLKPGFQIWGTATGSVPYHRVWYLTDTMGEIISILDQGCYHDPQSAVVQRREWVKGCNALGLLWRKNKQGQMEAYDPYTGKLSA